MNVLVVAAHPDDEILGCGGTVARHVSEGDSVASIIVAEGATARADGTAADLAALKDAARRAAKVLGAEPPRMLGLPDNRLDTLPLLDAVQAIEAVVAEFAPAIVYTHHGGDLNVDHRIVHQAVATACRPVPGSPVKHIFCFETPSSTEWAVPSLGPTFAPVHFVDIAPHIEAKKASLDCYGMEMRPFPHPRSIEAVMALATVRGSQAGLPAAEAFETLLHIRG